MVSEHSGAQQPEFELPGWAWGAVGTVIGFGLVFWLGFGIMADLTTSDFASAAIEPAPAAAATSGVRAVATEFAFSDSPAQPAGIVEIALINEGSTFHNLEIVGPDGTNLPGFILEADPGVTVASEIDLAPGAYILFCSVPGHREAGMETTLEITG